MRHIPDSEGGSPANLLAHDMGVTQNFGGLYDQISVLSSVAGGHP